MNATASVSRFSSGSFRLPTSRKLYDENPLNTVTHHSVDKLSLERKRTLEALRGHTLEAEQQVFIFASTPGASPDDASRLAAHDSAAIFL